MSAVTENHGTPRHHGVYHQPWFYRVSFTSVKLPRTVLEFSVQSSGFFPREITGLVPVLHCPHKTKKMPGLRSNRQLEAPLPLDFLCRISRVSAKNPAVVSIPKPRALQKSLVHSLQLQCGKAVAVFVSSLERDLVAQF